VVKEAGSKGVVKKGSSKEKKGSSKEKKGGSKADQTPSFPDRTWEPLQCVWTKRVIAWKGPPVLDKPELPDGWFCARGERFTIYNNPSITVSNVGDPSGAKAPRKPTEALATGLDIVR
jgi:hypothetical protein